ncbi:hypothetical protein J7E81_08790 [Bacillus sp. ISL-18]|uniref:hypothetical protein n=1 Tax=Bacillus sp. ISL-18 TaxID=2819118 RepID=UPI001BE67E4B|nr:hypothetical protein [Bacillus sp. ISL-18]MBT2655333.1 hypothetical protein [Bacillus sp. ISL-18]
MLIDGTNTIDVIKKDVFVYNDEKNKLKNNNKVINNANYRYHVKYKININIYVINDNDDNYSIIIIIIDDDAYLSKLATGKENNY